ncbi:hypothetical protein ACFLYG_03410 [Chloroflexota bacterium]
MGFTNRHPILSAFIGFVLITLPVTINAWWLLWEKFKAVEMPSLNFGVLDWIFPALGLALFIIVIWQLKRNKTEVLSDYNYEMIRYGTILRNMMNEDISKPNNCLSVEFRHVKIDHIGDKAGPYLVFEFSVHSSSVYEMQFNKEPKGHLIYEGQELKDEPEFPLGSLMSQKLNLLRKHTGLIELRQFLLPEIASGIMDLSDKRTNQVSFEFNQIDIPIDVINPNGDVVTTWRCPIPPKVTFCLPTSGSIAFPC